MSEPEYRLAYRIYYADGPKHEISVYRRAIGPATDVLHYMRLYTSTPADFWLVPA